jgi:WD40 repeat protein
MMTFDVFISYSTKDKATADAACATLEAAGVRCWIAPRDVLPGADWGASIIDAIDTCRAMVLIFSSSANGSPQIRNEVVRAVNRGVPVVPVRIENIEPTKALAYFMGAVHWLDALTPPLESHLRHLATSLKTLLKLPEGPERVAREQIKEVGLGQEQTEAQAATGQARRERVAAELTSKPELKPQLEEPRERQEAQKALRRSDGKVDHHEQVETAPDRVHSTGLPENHPVDAAGAERNASPQVSVALAVEPSLDRQPEISSRRIGDLQQETTAPIAASVAPVGRFDVSITSDVPKTWPVSRRGLVIGGGAIALGAAGVWVANRSRNLLTGAEAPSASTQAPMGSAKGHLLRTFTGHSGYVYSVAFSPDGSTALSGSEDRTLKLWNIATGDLIRTFTGHGDGVHSVAFSPDGRTALSGSEDQTMKLWDVPTGREIRTFTAHPHPVSAVAFSPDGRSALGGGYATLTDSDITLRLWDIVTGKLVRSFASDWVTSIAFSPDGRSAMCGNFRGGLWVWEVASGKRLHLFRSNSGLFSVAFVPDGRGALSCGDGFVRLTDIATGNVIRTFGQSGGRNLSVASSPDGRFALSAQGDGLVKLWNVDTGASIRDFPSPSDAFALSVAFSPDGRAALSGHYDKTLKLWDLMFAG